MTCVGLTGGIGAGKTTVARMFSYRGAWVVEADRIIHHLLMPQGPACKPVSSIWGDAVCTGEGRIDRKRLASIVFKDRDALNRLVDILYPLLKHEVTQAMARAKHLHAVMFILDGSQILEAGWEGMFDLIVLVRARGDVCRERMLRRGIMDPEQFRLRRGLQWPEWVKTRHADFIIDNSGSRHMTERAVNGVFDQIVGDTGRNCRM
ncbi:MAG: dephospho-CoA kinase [bacterium]